MLRFSNPDTCTHAHQCSWELRCLLSSIKLSRYTKSYGLKNLLRLGCWWQGATPPPISIPLRSTGTSRPIIHLASSLVLPARKFIFVFVLDLLPTDGNQGVPWQFHDKVPPSWSWRASQLCLAGSTTMTSTPPPPSSTMRTSGSGFPYDDP